MLVKLALIDFDPNYSPRIERDAIIVARYADALRMGAKFPPIVLAEKDGRYLLLDGLHRFEAHKETGAQDIEATLSKAKSNEWFREAVRLNVANGLPLRESEKLLAAKKLLDLGTKLDAVAALLCVPSPKLTRLIAQKHVPNLPTAPIRPVTKTGSPHPRGQNDYRVEYMGDIFGELTTALATDSVPKSLEKLIDPLAKAIVAWCLKHQRMDLVIKRPEHEQMAGWFTTAPSTRESAG